MNSSIYHIHKQVFSDRFIVWCAVDNYFTLTGKWAFLAKAEAITNKVNERRFGRSFYLPINLWIVEITK